MSTGRLDWSIRRLAGLSEPPVTLPPCPTASLLPLTRRHPPPHRSTWSRCGRLDGSPLRRRVSRASSARRRRRSAPSTACSPTPRCSRSTRSTSWSGHSTCRSTPVSGPIHASCSTRRPPARPGDPHGCSSTGPTRPAMCPSRRSRSCASGWAGRRNRVARDRPRLPREPRPRRAGARPDRRARAGHGPPAQPRRHHNQAELGLELERGEGRLRVAVLHRRDHQRRTYQLVRTPVRPARAGAAAGDPRDPDAAQGRRDSRAGRTVRPSARRRDDHRPEGLLPARGCGDRRGCRRSRRGRCPAAGAGRELDEAGLPARREPAARPGCTCRRCSARSTR